MVEECLDGCLFAFIVVGVIWDETHKTAWKRSTRTYSKLLNFNTYFAHHQYLQNVSDIQIRASHHIPGPPNTLISSDELPPLSLIGMT